MRSTNPRKKSRPTAPGGVRPDQDSPRKQRRALTNVGGPVELRGDRALGDVLRRAADVSADETAARRHVHGFHSYPARLHPQSAERLVRALGEPRASLLDPFCGSGTVLVEGRLAGLAVRGADINPLAIRLARLKSIGVTSEERDVLLETAAELERHAEARRLGRAAPTRRYGPEDTELFPPHILWELDSLRDGLDRVQSRALREDLELVLSAILTKVGARTADSHAAASEHRLPGGYVSHLFVRKTEELVRALADFERRVPPGTAPPDVRSDDARTLGTVSAASVDLVVSSPPYAATYDYLAQHAMRLRWLGLRSDRFEELELGARRSYAALSPDQAEARWRAELGGFLGSLGRVLRPQGRAILVLGDSAVGPRALRADDFIEELAEGAALEVQAIASQARPHFHGPSQRAFRDQPRREHFIAVGRRRGAVGAATAVSP